jgi:hypothetical protein
MYVLIYQIVKYSEDKTLSFQVWDLKSILGQFHSELSTIEQKLATSSPNSFIQGLPNHIGEEEKSVDLVEVVAHYKYEDINSRPETTCLAFNRYVEIL